MIDVNIKIAEICKIMFTEFTEFTKAINVKHHRPSKHGLSLSKLLLFHSVTAAATL